MLYPLVKDAGPPISRSRLSHCAPAPGLNILTAALVLLATFISTSSHALPRSEVGTSDNQKATAASAQRKVVYDPVEGNYWAFYSENAQITYAYSADGINWIETGTLGYPFAYFSVTYAEENGSSYVLVVVAVDSHIYLIRGSPGSTSITFEAPVSVDFLGGSNSYRNPVVTVASDDTIWIAALRDFGQRLDGRQVEVRRSINPFHGALNSWSSATILGQRTTAENLQQIALVPADGSEVQAFLSTEGSGHVTAYRYNGNTWIVDPLANHGAAVLIPNGITGAPSALLLHGGDLYMAGTLRGLEGDSHKNDVVRWDGSTWHALGNGVGAPVVDLAAAPSGTIYASRAFPPSNSADRMQSWNGTAWQNLGAGITNGMLSAVVVAQQNNAELLYAGGIFSDAGGVAAADNLAVWDGTSWSAVGGTTLNGSVSALHVMGNGDLIVAGSFTDAGGNTAADYLAKWDGTTWSDLGDSGLGSSVQAITSIVYGPGCESIYVGGYMIPYLVSVLRTETNKKAR